MVWFTSLLGQRGERLAAQYLKRKGYRVVARNFHTRGGEIDLVCQDGDCLVFVEVKTRTAGGLGNPEDAMTVTKGQRLQHALQGYLAQLRKDPPAYRIDVVSIEIRADGSKEIFHYENITG